MSSTNTSNNPNPSPPSPSTSSSSRKEAKKKFTSPLHGLFGTKKSPSPPATQQKNAPRSSLDSEVTLLDTKKSSKSKSEVRTTESESEIEIEIERKDRYSRRRGSGSGSGSGSGTRSRTAEVPTMAGWGLEVGWGLLARGAAEDLCIPTYGSVYAHTFVLGRATMGLTTTRSPYDNTLSRSTSSSSSPSSGMRDSQEEKKDYKTPRPPMNFH